ncbi:hypothetical protein ACIQAC_12945 [Streptomyces sp. NPDC088387]|uniref:hypothetical protein n=1 Tax=Streptomyces sp. NPDC088387 TaxID=3365859 RepID=UPI003801B448
MPDRSQRLVTLTPPSALGGQRSGVLLRERPTSPPDASSNPDGGGQNAGGQNAGGQNAGGQNSGGRAQGGQEDNPFAPPPEGRPDQPWQPRRPEGASGDGSQEGGAHGSGSQGGGDRSAWGNQWSDHQPGRSSDGGFGERPGPGGHPEGPGNPGPGLRWDPTDPGQRRARYALLSGMWAFFFALFAWPYVALLLGALAMYWAISALRATPRPPDPDNPAPQTATPTKPPTTAAITGLVTASLAIVLVAASFVAQLVYSDYYTCTSDALTNEARQSCSQLLPEQLRGVLGTEG